MSRKRITASKNPTTLLLPQEILDTLGIDDGDEVDVSIMDGTLVLRPLDEVEHAQKIDSATKNMPIAEPEFTLEDLLAKVTKHNSHQEIDTGSACGKEAW